MSMSMHVTAFRDMDGQFKRMFEVKKFCDSHSVSYPKEVTEYFGNNVSKLDSDTRLYEDFAEIDLDDKLSEWVDTKAPGCINSLSGCGMTRIFAF